ncbi:helix-turn-helix domain-containing protein [Filimonas lacunae]|uniref:helix-turn-helix domain-containing protein n=1 Tax=Filimonas lacunae TaxID=477680 RepID=UPI001185CD92|nr:helix-turn-helix transcriptional regulator [Filimonas lacunae]
MRKHRKLQQEGMQDALGISRATWSNYENGKTEPSIQTLLQIATYFNVSVDDLLRTDLSQHPDWQQQPGAINYKQQLKRNLQNKDSLIALHDSGADIPNTLLQEILDELKLIRQHITHKP